MTARSHIWENIEALMRHKGLKLTIDSVAEKTKLGRGTVQRLRSGDQSIGVDNLEKAARAFGLSAWQLLVPNLNPAVPPALADERMPRFDFATLAYEHAKTFREERQRIAIVKFLDEVASALAQLRDERTHRVINSTHPKE